MRQHDGHASGARCHRLQHVLHESIVGAAARRHPGKVAAISVVGPNILAPPLQAERWIGDYAVKRGKAVASEERGGTERVTANDLEILDPMQKQVHSGDGACGQVLPPAEELAPPLSNIPPALLNLRDRAPQHAASALSWI